MSVIVSVVIAILLYALAIWVVGKFGLGLKVSGFGPAFIAAIVVLSDYPCVPQDIVVPHGKKSGKQSITFKVKEKALKEMVEIK
jgi:hypothetical protein